MASQRSAVWRSHAVTVKATSAEGICSSRVAKTVPSAPTLKSTLSVSYCVPVVPKQLLNVTARGGEKGQGQAGGGRWPATPQEPRDRLRHAPRAGVSLPGESAEALEEGPEEKQRRTSGPRDETPALPLRLPVTPDPAGVWRGWHGALST